MAKVNVQHRSYSSSENCLHCEAILRNVQKGRRLTPGQQLHAGVNRAILDERAQPELAVQGGLFDEVR